MNSKLLLALSGRLFLNATRRYCTSNVFVNGANAGNLKTGNEQRQQRSADDVDEPSSEIKVTDTDLTDANDVDLGTVAERSKYGTLIISVDPKNFPKNATVLSLDDLNVCYKDSSLFHTYCKAEVSFCTKYAYWLDEETKQQILLKNKDRLNENEFVTFTSEASASRQANFEECIKQLRECVASARNMPIENVVITDMYKITKDNI